MRWKLLVLFFVTVASGYGQSSIYTFQIDSIAGNKKIKFSDFAGKKILIVNTASQDSSNQQYDDLKSLNLFFKDSLIIIAIPVGNFGHEPGTNNEIEPFYSQNMSNRFPVAAKISADGNDIHPLYNWLTKQTENGMSNSKVSGDYKKYLIDSNGKMVGVFSSKLRANSSIIMQAIKICK